MCQRGHRYLGKSFIQIHLGTFERNFPENSLKNNLVCILCNQIQSTHCRLSKSNSTMYKFVWWKICRNLVDNPTNMMCFKLNKNQLYNLNNHFMMVHDNSKKKINIFHLRVNYNLKKIYQTSRITNFTFSISQIHILSL